MKKLLSSHQTAYFPPITLYKNDVEEIVARLNSACESIEYSDGIHEFDNIDDIKTHLGPCIKKLSIKGISPNITINIGKRLMDDDVDLSMSVSSAETKLLFHELKDFLQQKLKWISRVNFRHLWFFTVGSFAIMPQVLFFKSYLQNNVYMTYFAMIFLVITVIYLSLYMYKWKIGSTIYLDPKHNYNFWYTNKDKIIVGLITAIISILGTLLTQYIIKKLF